MPNSSGATSALILNSNTAQSRKNHQAALRNRILELPQRQNLAIFASSVKQYTAAAQNLGKPAITP
jgi:hypothetical protein